MQDLYRMVCTSFYAVSHVSLAYHATMRHTPCLATHLTMPVKAALHTPGAPRRARACPHCLAPGVTSAWINLAGCVAPAGRRGVEAPQPARGLRRAARLPPRRARAPASARVDRTSRATVCRPPAAPSLQALARRGSCCARRRRRWLCARARAAPEEHAGGLLLVALQVGRGPRGPGEGHAQDHRRRGRAEGRRHQSGELDLSGVNCKAGAGSARREAVLLVWTIPTTQRRAYVGTRQSRVCVQTCKELEHYGGGAAWHRSTCMSV